MASSFNGVTIYVLADGTPRKTNADVNIRHIPGGNQSFVDIGGQNLRVLDLSLYFEYAADSVSFEAQMGQVGTLVIPDGTFTAVLTQLARISRGLSTTGDAVLQCEFNLL